jgi:hypothetical protein
MTSQHCYDLLKKLQKVHNAKGSRKLECWMGRSPLLTKFVQWVDRSDTNLLAFKIGYDMVLLVSISLLFLILQHFFVANLQFPCNQFVHAAQIFLIISCAYLFLLAINQTVWFVTMMVKTSSTYGNFCLSVWDADRCVSQLSHSLFFKINTIGHTNTQAGEVE